MRENVVNKPPKETLRDRLRLERGQTMSEYAVVLMMISSTTAVLFPQLASSVTSAITGVARLLP
jgi:Flp pilus assembly pilin Flp